MASITTPSAALTIAGQDLFTMPSEWTMPSTTDPIQHDSFLSEAKDQQQVSDIESMPQSFTDADYDINKDRQFQRFLRRFGGQPKTRYF
ncbi:hypothetical protein FBU30_003724 [Linnemannia zychae]|nr:hypothetical protein FBU30_003724 [Linnemannia zychae]